MDTPHQAEQKIDLLLFPFAGGSSYAYAELTKLLAPHIRAIPVEYPGHGKRMQEPLMTNLSAMIKDVYARYSGEIRHPFAIYGHSMGGLMGYYWTRMARENGAALPLHLIFTGCAGPAHSRPNNYRYLLPRKDFFEMIREFGGSPDEILNNEELMAFFEPILRADLQAVDTYQYQKKPPFNLPISVFLGREEKTTYEEGMLWQQETIQPINLQELPGGHFFIHDHLLEIAQFINEKLVVMAR